MDPNALAGMLFVLLLAALVGGFILLLPISRRLGMLLEERISEKKRPVHDAEELRMLHASVQAMQEQLEELGERQMFTEKLLASRQQRELSPPERAALD